MRSDHSVPEGFVVFVLSFLFMLSCVGLPQETIDSSLAAEIGIDVRLFA